MRRYIAIVAAALGCDAPPPTPHTPPWPSPSARTVSETSGAPSASATAVDPLAERLAIARSLCSPAIKRKDGDVLIGCRACPFNVDPGRPDSSVVVDPDEFWPIHALFHGSFSKPGAHEVAAIVKGCAQHGLDVIVFAEQASGSWRAMTSLMGEVTERCDTYRRHDGRELLVCQSGVTWFDAHSTYVTAYDLARATADDPSKARLDLVRVAQNAHAVCWALSQNDGVVQGRVLGFRFDDTDHDGQQDIVVDVTHRATPASASLEQVIENACAEARARNGKRGNEPSPMPVPIDVAPLLGEPVKETLLFLFDGQEFLPTPKTAARLEHLAPFM
ncbi:MAG: hypothetical protein HOW73_14975 [Polyangiaceae bacterium]|nr:hypothetical protein [Polyangiaceae bacterium]